MKLLDSNIFIYIGSGRLSLSIIREVSIAHASVSSIEALGYPSMRIGELQRLQAIFELSFELALSGAIMTRAIQLKQDKTMSLGDAIIAATALEHDLELWTANTKDFAHINGLNIYNPLDDA